jgi:hypothetical protein
MTLWTVPRVSMRAIHDSGILDTQTRQPYPADSAVTMYWDERELRPGERREVGFAYGLGTVAGGESGGKLGLSVGGQLVRDGDFTLTANVFNPGAGEKLTLTLPDGFKVEGSTERSVPALAGRARSSPVTWQIHAGRAGSYKLQVRSSKGAKQTLTIRVKPKGVYD